MYLTVQIVEHMDNQRMCRTVFIDFKKEDLRWLDTVFNNLGVRQFDTLRFCVFKFHLTDTD